MIHNIPDYAAQLKHKRERFLLLDMLDALLFGSSCESACVLYRYLIGRSAHIAESGLFEAVRHALEADRSLIGSLFRLPSSNKRLSGKFLR